MEWKEYKLGDVCSRLRSGKSIKSELVLDKGLFPVIGGNGVRGYTDTSNFNGCCAVIGRQGAYCGNVRYFEGEAYMTEHAVVVVGNDLVDTRYLASLLSLMHLGNLSAQSAQPGLSVQTLSKQIIHLPSLESQKKVSAILKSLDDKIENNRKINENLEQQAQALFKSWFVDFEPFRDQPFVDSELGMIPEGWRVVELGDFIHSIKEKVGERCDVKVLSPISTGELVLSEDFFSKQVFSESIEKYIIVRPKDFAYNPARVNIGSLGMNTFSFDGCVSPVYVVLRCKNGYEQYFNYFRKRKAFNKEVASRAIGGVRQSLSYQDFSLIKAVYPPKHVIDRYNNIIEKLHSVVKRNNDENSNLAQLRDTLLPKLMSGEINLDNI